MGRGRREKRNGKADSEEKANTDGCRKVGRGRREERRGKVASEIKGKYEWK